MMKAKLNKKEVVKRLSERTGLSKRFLNNFISILLEEMKNTLDLNEKIKIINFGTFEVRKAKDRIGKNFKTGETIKVKGVRKVFFYPASDLKKLLDERPKKENSI